MENEQGGIID